MSKRAANLLGALSLLVVEHIETTARERTGLGGQSAAAIVVLGYGNGITIDRLRRILGLSHPGTVRLVDKLASLGLVTRFRGADRREVPVRLTEQGREMRGRLLDGRLTAVAELIKSLSADDTAKFADLLASILQAMDTTETERFHICRMCDDTVCDACPLPTSKSNGLGGESAT